MFHRNKDEFLRRFITMDEKWFHHFTPKPKEQSKQWTGMGKSCPKQVKTVPSVAKVCFFFWNAYGIIFFFDYLQKGTTINGEYYDNFAFNWWNYRGKRRIWRKRKCWFIETIHTSTIAKAKIKKSKFELSHPALYSPNLAPSDYFLFPNWKQWW